MASNSLGTLTLDLVARIGGFTAPLDQAERRALKNAKGIEAAAAGASIAWSRLGNVVGGLFAGLTIGGVYTKFIGETRAAEAEQAQLAAVLRSTGEAAGFTREQLNDMAAQMEGRSIFSAGEINTAQTALLAFTGIVGEQFPTALQAAMDMSARTGMTVTQAAETIGRALDVPSKGLTALSKQGFRFTEDQKALAKQLEASGKTAEAQGIILGALQESYGGAAQAARDNFGGALTALQNTIDGLMTGQDGSLEGARISIEELNAALADPSTAAGVATLTNALAGMATEVVESIPFIIDAGDGVVRVFNVLANTLVGMYATAAGRIQNLAADAALALSILPDFAGGEAFSQRSAAYRSQAQQNFDIAAQAAAAIKENLETPLKGTAMAELGKQALEAKRALGEPGKPGSILDGEGTAAALKAQEEAAKALAKADREAQKVRERAAAAIQSQVEALQLQAATVGMTTRQLALYRLEQAGATEGDLERARASLDVVDAHRRQEAYKDLLRDLRTDEEVLTDQMRERLEVMDAISGLTERERDEVAAKVIDQATAKAPRFGGLDASVGGAAGELLKIDEAEAKLQEWYSKQLEIVEAGRAERADLNAQWDAEELALAQQHQDELARIEHARQMAQLAAGEEFFGNMSGVAKTFFGEQSSMYKAMFAVEKAYALAKVLMNAPKTASDAYSAMAGIPYVGPALGIAAAAAALTYQAAQAAGISSISLDGMAHDGIDSVPADGTWLLQKGERVTTASTSDKLDRTLDDVRRNGAVAGGNQITQEIVINGNPSDQTLALVRQAAADGARMGYQMVSNDLASGRGSVAKGLQAGYSVGRRKT
ncbi:phage tail length tape measure family protein [Ectopseudomonas composti]